MTKRMILTTLGALLATTGCAADSSPSKSADYPAMEPAGSYDRPQATANYDGADASSSEEAEMRPMPAPQAPPAGGAAHRYAPKTEADPFDIAPKETRPGLATSWGEVRHSRVSSAPFMRADKVSPFAVGKLFYNDPQGIAAMSDSHPGSRRSTRRFALGAGHLELGLRDGGGHFLTGFEMGGANYMAGVAGRRYTIVLKNHSPGRVEAVVSVDGLDVIDGKPAAFQKRGYLIDAFGDLEIEGFRTSNTAVAAFRFGSVKQSYANKKHGETRNVGVIGVALFHESGDNPHSWGSPRSHQDVTTRHGADPFPNKYASPPE